MHVVDSLWKYTQYIMYYALIIVSVRCGGHQGRTSLYLT